MCEGKDLEAYRKYILFLNNKQPGEDFYTQVTAAEPETKIEDLMNICGLELSFPKGRYQSSLKLSLHYLHYAHNDIHI